MVVILVNCLKPLNLDLNLAQFFQRLLRISFLIDEVVTVNKLRLLLDSYCVFLLEL